MAGMKETMVQLQIDGRAVTVPAGTRLIEAARSIGIEIPRYCYHEALPVEGSCRLCAVEIEGQAKLQLSCATPVAEGMVVRTDTERVRDARRAVLEFLLLNHPLDCPICDKAGECQLQDYYFAHSAADSRLTHDKWHKGKRVDLGPTIVMDEERCILCGRCVRFMDHVAGRPVLGRFTRGSHTRLGVMPGDRFDNPYSLNTVDICPVGALTSKDFRFRKRPWFLRATRTVCHGCATGCSMKVEEENGRIWRLRPVKNPAVNGPWLCDAGRLLYHRREENPRCLEPRLDGEPASAEAVLGRFAETFLNTKKRGGSLAIIASNFLTLEEAWLSFQLARETGATLLLPHLPGGFVGNEEADGILQDADKSPNREGLRRVAAAQRGVTVVADDAVTAHLQRYRPAALILVGEDTSTALPPEARSILTAVPHRGAIAWCDSPLTDGAEFQLPGRHLFEKDGCLINRQAILQRLHAAVAPPAGTRDDVEWLALLLSRAGRRRTRTAVADVFGELREKLPGMAGLKFHNLPADGVKI